MEEMVMNKIAEFYKKVMSDEVLKEKFYGIVGDVTPDKLSDEALGKLEELTKELGFEISVEEAKSYFNSNEVSEEDLEKVSGGYVNDDYDWRKQREEWEAELGKFSRPDDEYEEGKKRR